MTVHALLLERLAPERVRTMSDAELMRLVAGIWADLEARALLAGSRDFMLERLHHFARRGWLTARERHGIEDTLFGGAVTYAQKLESLRRTSD